MPNRPIRTILLWSCCLIFTVASWIPATPARADSKAQPTPSASEVFRTAYENRYVWDSDFPGYTATVEINQDGETYQGQIEIDSDLNISVMDIEDEDAYESVYSGLQMLIIHRRSVPFDRLHQEHTFSFGPVQDNGAVEIDQAGGDTPSFYLVKNGQITQVNRLMPTVGVTVDLLDSQETSMGYLGTRYHAYFKTPETGEVIAEVDFEDSYEQASNYYIPHRQVIRSIDNGQSSQIEIKLTDIQLLS